MLDFDKFLARYGEVVAQAILENIERHEGVRSCTATTLEMRWKKMMQSTHEQECRAA